MKLEQSFTVAAPVEQVWAALIDVERVAPCLPGAAITGQRRRRAPTRARSSVKLGPTTAAYRGTLKMEALDEATHTATMKRARAPTSAARAARRATIARHAARGRRRRRASTSSPTSRSPAAWRASGAAG